MSEEQFQIIHLGNPYEFVVKDNTTNKTYGPFEGDEKSMSDLLNDQQDHIIYWKHKVNSLLWILGQFDKAKVKKLLKEIDDE